MTVSSADLLYDPQVWCYFAILGWSLRGQVRRATRRGLAAACALVGITWFYIFRFTLAYKNGGGANLFDDAYADVLRGPHARSSCQLLTWVVVAFTLAPSRDVLWTGMLGAMSAAYSLSPPDLAPPPRVATLDAACALASLACVAALPRLLDAPAAFGAVLKALHALLVLPRYAPALPGSVDATVFYGAVAVLVGARRDRVSAVPATDCQASIFVDLVACAALSVAAVRRRRGPGVAAAFAAGVRAVPGGALALYLALESAAAAAAPRERTAARFGRVLVVGAGASGLAQGSKRVRNSQLQRLISRPFSTRLATAKTLLEHTDADVVVAERAGTVGGVFADAYEGARMVSSKYVTAFSDFRLGRGAESHLALDAYVAYLERYVDRFGLARKIEFGTTVRAVARAGGRYAVETEAGGVARTRSFDRVAVCSGLHTHPKTPALPGRFRGDVFHSRDYASPGRFAGRRVVVVGAGETAFDVAHGAASAGARAVTMSTRRGFVSVPASFGEGVAPLDCIIANAGTHCWESAWARRVGLHWWITTKFQRLGMLVLGGSSKGWNQWVGASVHMDWTEGRKHIVNKATKCMPLLNRSAKGPAWNPYRFWDSAASRVAVGVDLLDKYEPVKFESDGVAFRSLDGGPDRVVGADVVVFATGYRQKFPFLFGAGAGDDPLPGRHFLVDDAEPDLAFIGFVRPNVGAIPPMAELQAMWWIARLRGDVSDGPGDYALTDRRLDYGVDYGLYMFALAKEMGAAPSLAKWLLAGRPDVVVAAAFGQAHAPLLRLDGPFTRRDAADVCGGELLEPIRMRGILNLVFLGNVLFFGVVNAFLGAVESFDAAFSAIALLSAVIQVLAMPLRAIALLSAAHQGIQVARPRSVKSRTAPRFLRSSLDLLAAKEPAQLDRMSRPRPRSRDRFLRSSASAQDLLAAKEPAQLDDISHGQESLVALSGDSSSSDVEAAASLKGRFLRSSASAQDLLAAKEPAQLDDISHGQDGLAQGRFLRSSASAQDLLAAKEPAQLDDISHGQESLVALSGDSPSSDAEAAASLKGRFLRSSASAQDLLAAKEPAQLDDISHAQESLVALSGDSPSSDAEAAASLKGPLPPLVGVGAGPPRGQGPLPPLVELAQPAQLDDISHAQESLVALSGDSPSSDAEAAASLKGRFLRSSASAQDLLAAKEPAQLDDISHAQESLVALSGDSPSSDAEAAASLKGRFLRSSASAQDLLAAKEPAQLDDISHGQESLVALSGDSPSSDAEARPPQGPLPPLVGVGAGPPRGQGARAARQGRARPGVARRALRRLAVLGREAAASLKGRFLRSSASAQDLVKSKEPAQLRDFDQSQVESSSAHVAPPQHRDKVLIEKRYLRSSGSEQDLVKSKEPVQFDDGLFGKTRLARSIVGGEESTPYSRTHVVALIATDGKIASGTCGVGVGDDEDDGNCGETQYGCPSTACDGDSYGPWCMDENLVNWFYCAYGGDGDLWEGAATSTTSTTNAAVRSSTAVKSSSRRPIVSSAVRATCSRTSRACLWSASTCTITGFDHVCSKIIDAEKVLIHPDYDTSTMENDVALMFLSEPAPCAADGRTKTVTLDRSDSFDPYAGEEAHGRGLGRATNKQGSEYPNRLREVALDFIDNDACSSKWCPWWNPWCQSPISPDVMLCVAWDQRGEGFMLR
ncbi:N,N-dimethylaniline monooxygenase [Aureococcus anophagefferens]|uniref:N,N-dimethylaniline monooxygenase n=1 Tax=Aureococcus anophagefferens TaxID=44056 RepID=A0ABR1G9D6_AURAN